MKNLAMRYRYFLIGTVAIGILALFSGCNSQEALTEEALAKPVKSFVVDEQHRGMLRNFPGKVLANREAELAFEISGRLTELPVSEGDELQQGDFIAAIDPEIYANKVSEAQARYDLAQANLKRGDELVVNNFLSRAEHDILRAELAVEAANLSIANRDLRNTKIYAPFDGIVAVKYVDNYEYVRAQQAIVQFNDTERVDIEVYIPEYLVLATSRDDPDVAPYAVFESMPGREFSVQFKEYSAQADPQTQTYRAVLTMPIPEGVNVLPGMSASVRGMIPSGVVGGAHEVPVTAVFADEQGQSYVWIVDGESMKIRQQAVTIGEMVKGMILVTEGVDAGDTLVATGAHFLQDGQAVRFITQQDKP